MDKLPDVHLVAGVPRASEGKMPAVFLSTANAPAEARRSRSLQPDVGREVQP